MTDVPDRIERSIDIVATAEEVWALISTPGWWINDGELREHRIEQRGDLAVVHDPVHGVFPLRVGPHEPPRRAVYAWRPQGGDAGPETGTVVTFTIADRPGGVRLTVVESGFASLELPDDRRRANHAENTDGWEQMLDLARRSAGRQ